MKTHRQRGSRATEAAVLGLCHALLTLKDENECRDFLRDLCTPAELEALADRWSVVGYIDAGLPYRRIRETTGVSVTTIGRVARYLTAGSGGYRTALGRINGA